MRAGHDGGLCAFDGYEQVARYLRATCSTGAERSLRTVTVLVPASPTRAGPACVPLGGAGFSGASVSGATTADTVLESAGTTVHATGPETFRALGAWLRERAARSLTNSAELTALVTGTVLRVRSQGARVTIEDPDLTATSFSNEAGTVLSATPGRIEIALDAGTFALDLASGVLLP